MYNNGDPAPLETSANSAFGVRRTFWNNTNTASAITVAKSDVAMGRVPLLSFKVGTWTNAVNGGVDAWAKDTATKLSAVGGRVMVAIHHEPEGDDDIALWVKMQQRLAPLFNVKNVDFGIVVTGWNQIYGPTQYSLPNIWPTGAPVDFIGFDIYQSYGAKNPDCTIKTRAWTDMKTAYFDKIKPFAESKGVYWGLAETGLTDEAWNERAEAKTWFTDVPAKMKASGGSFFAYFNSAQNSGCNTWPLSGEKQLAFVRALSIY